MNTIAALVPSDASRFRSPRAILSGRHLQPIRHYTGQCHLVACSWFVFNECSIFHAPGPTLDLIVGMGEALVEC